MKESTSLNPKPWLVVGKIWGRFALCFWKLFCFLGSQLFCLENKKVVPSEAQFLSNADFLRFHQSHHICSDRKLSWTKLQVFGQDSPYGPSELRASLVYQMVMNLPAMCETQVRSLGGEDPLEKDGSPLQYSCLENSMDRGAWWAAVHGVAKSQMSERLTLSRADPGRWPGSMSAGQVCSVLSQLWDAVRPLAPPLSACPEWSTDGRRRVAFSRD